MLTSWKSNDLLRFLQSPDEAMKMVVANSPSVPLTEKSILIEPTDVLTLATWLRSRAHDVTFLDLDRHGLTPLELMVEHFDLAVLVLDYYIPLHTTATHPVIKSTVRLLKERASFTVMVGRPATYRYPELLHSIEYLDACVVGEAEFVLERLCTKPELTSNVVCPGLVTRENSVNPVSKHSAIPSRNFFIDGIPSSGPIASRDFCKLDDYIDVRSIISSRGCQGVCRYCSTVAYWRRWRAAPAELIIAEMRYLIGLGGHKIIFLDDNFTGDSARVRQVCALIKERSLRCAWGCLSRVEDVSPDLMAEMRGAGCSWIHFGIEHGDPGVRSRIGKNFTDEQAIQVIDCAKRLGIRTRTSWILDLPGTTRHGLQATFRLARRLASEEIKIHFLVIRPGSIFYQAKYPELTPSTDEMFIHRGTSSLSQTNISNAEIRELLDSFRLEASMEGYQWVDDVRFWRRFDRHEALPSDRFLSTVITRYGLAW